MLPLPFNSLVKYRYIRRGGVQVFEDTNSSAAIRYRMHLVAGPGEVRDIVSDWEINHIRVQPARSSGGI